VKAAAARWMAIAQRHRQLTQACHSATRQPRALSLCCAVLYLCVSAGKNWVASEAAHEARVAVELGLRPGMKVLDCGCGVGGPMRTVASVSGAHVTGAWIPDNKMRVVLVACGAAEVVVRGTAERVCGSSASSINEQQGACGHNIWFTFAQEER
jgi:protein-L-isoaspartate O-methyltransferase